MRTFHYLLLKFAGCTQSDIPRNPSPRQIYIDLGVNWANTLRLFETIAPQRSSRPWEIFGFEASPLIQPYADQFCSWLNGERDHRPNLCLPPAGSTRNLKMYSQQLGCARKSGSLMRACMFRRFDSQLRALRPNPHLNNTGEICKRLALGRIPLAQAATNSRYTLIPAAVSSQNGWLQIESPPHALIRGGAHFAKTAEILEYSAASTWFNREDYTYIVPSVDVATWIVQSFSQEDFLFLKVDIEGAEFGFLAKLVRLDGMRLVDVLSMECHENVLSSRNGRSIKQTCARLESRIRGAAANITILREKEHGGLDRYSSPPSEIGLQRWAHNCGLLSAGGATMSA